MDTELLTMMGTAMDLREKVRRRSREVECGSSQLLEWRLWKALDFALWSLVQLFGAMLEYERRTLEAQEPKG